MDSIWDYVSLEFRSPMTEHARVLEQQGLMHLHESDGAVFHKDKPPLEKKSLCIETLQPFYRKTLFETACALNVSETVLKSKCREFNIKKWPSRKINSLDKVFTHMKNLYAQYKIKNEKTRQIFEDIKFVFRIIKKYEKEGYMNETKEEMKRVRELRKLYRPTYRI